MSRIQSLFKREAGVVTNLNLEFALRRLCVTIEDDWRGIVPTSHAPDFNPEPPIFAAKFATAKGFRHMLAIANEDGKIALQNTNIKGSSSEDEKLLKGPLCHYNAVFDLEWAPSEMRFVSASGDHTARLWDVSNERVSMVRTFVGHSRSVKTAVFRKFDNSIFATGGRDGAINIWDARANTHLDLNPRADNCITGGHAGAPGTPVHSRKRNRTPKIAQNTTSSSITGLAFQDSNTLISCGAGDGVIKVWDLRRNYTVYRREPVPKYNLPYAGSSTFKGFTNLVIDKTGSRLYANCMDNTIYSYNLFTYSPKPVANYKGLMNGTFYIKSCLSPDGKYLLSGSSNERAFVWDLDYPDEPVFALVGHNVEVTCVAWGSVGDCPIVTCSDDARHKIWRIGPENLSSDELKTYYRGHALTVRQFGSVQKKIKTEKNFDELQSTPRSLKRLVEENETTPNTTEKGSSKRSLSEMLGTTGDYEDTGDHGLKRVKVIESRGRRLFDPSTSSACQGFNNRAVKLLPDIDEEPSPSTSCFISSLGLRLISPTHNQENNQSSPLSSMAPKILCSTIVSPLSERTMAENLNYNYTSPPSTAAHSVTSSHIPNKQTPHQDISSVIFSPTSNLPNYVVDGEAPHLGIMSPKRKPNEKIDWLTQIRKQKLMSSMRGTTLAEKIAEEISADDACVSSLSSPRLQKLRNEGSPRLTLTPRRRASRSSSTCLESNASSPQHPRTPTSSRRNSETSILRFFSKMQNQQNASSREVHTSETTTRENGPGAISSSTNYSTNVTVPGIATSTTECTE